MLGYVGVLGGCGWDGQLMGDVHVQRCAEGCLWGTLTTTFPKRSVSRTQHCLLLLQAHANSCPAPCLPQALPTGATPNKPAKWKPFRPILENDNNG